MRAAQIILLILFLAPGMICRGENVRLLLWQGFKFSEVSLLKENVGEFRRDWNAKHSPDTLEIVVAQVPFNDMVSKIKSAALARQMPDIAFVDANMMVTLAFGQVACPLDELSGFPPEGIDGLRSEYVPGAFDTNVITMRGKRHLFGLPAQTTTLALFRNRKLFRDKAAELRAAGLDPERAPQDWDEFIRYGKILTDPNSGVYAFGMNNSFWFTMPFFNQYRAKLVDRDKEGLLIPTLIGPRAEAALTRKVDLWLKYKLEGGAFREGSLDPDQGFLNQRYAMILSGPWMIENFRSSGLDFGVSLIPAVPAAEGEALGIDAPTTRSLSAGNVGGQNIMVGANCRRPEIAFEFARFFSGERVQRAWAEKLGQIPVNKAAQLNVNLSQFPEIPVFIEQANLASPTSPLPFGSVLETEIYNPEMSLVLQGKKTPREALDSAATTLKRRILDPVNEAEKAAREKQ